MLHSAAPTCTTAQLILTQFSKLLSVRSNRRDQSWAVSDVKAQRGLATGALKCGHKHGGRGRTVKDYHKHYDKSAEQTQDYSVTTKALKLMDARHKIMWAKP